LLGIDRFKEKDWLKFGVTKAVEKARPMGDDNKSTEATGEPKPKRERKTFVQRPRRDSSFW
jgi:hypothetical protein